MTVWTVYLLLAQVPTLWECVLANFCGGCARPRLTCCNRRSKGQLARKELLSSSGGERERRNKARKSPAVIAREPPLCSTFPILCKKLLQY